MFYNLARPLNLNKLVNQFCNKSALINQSIKNKIKPVSRNFFSNKNNIEKELTDSISEFKKHNIQHVREINFTVNNPKYVSKFSVFRTHLFNAKIHMEKDNMTITKEFNSNDLTLLFKLLNEFIEKEIKI